MAFSIQITGAAQRDIAEATAVIHVDSPTIARDWLLGLSAAIQSLFEMPHRFALISEARELKRPLRSFPYHSHRIVYEVDEVRQMVSVLRVYHSGRSPLRIEDLTD